MQTINKVDISGSVEITALDETNIHDLLPSGFAIETKPVFAGTKLTVQVCEEFSFVFNVGGVLARGTIYTKDNDNIMVLNGIDKNWSIEHVAFKITNDFRKPHSYFLTKYIVEGNQADATIIPKLVKLAFKPITMFNGKRDQLLSHFTHARKDVIRIMGYFCILEQFEKIVVQHTGNTVVFYPHHNSIKLAIEFGNSIKCAIEYEHPIYGKRLSKITVEEFWTTLLHEYALNNKDYYIHDLVIKQNTLMVTDYKAVFDLFWDDILQK